eukprot:scaffold942_cov260-Pinguiococcus_pyrenoidosus.AAC.2
MSEDRWGTRAGQWLTIELSTQRKGSFGPTEKIHGERAPYLSRNQHGAQQRKEERSRLLQKTCVARNAQPPALVVRVVFVALGGQAVREDLPNDVDQEKIVRSCGLREGFKACESRALTGDLGNGVGKQVAEDGAETIRRDLGSQPKAVCPASVQEFLHR